jgi:DMSO reductase family type II enzyme chaperone
MNTAPAVTIDEATAARSELFGLLADGLEFPSKEFHLEVQARVFSEHVGSLLGVLPYQLAEVVDLAALANADDYVEFQGEYMRLFDIGAVRPPCPLYGGEWGGTRKRAMEEALRFYRFFGLKVDDGAHELPDHITVELEFMQVMAFTEGMTRARDEDPASFLRAERDFLERHPGKWWPMLQRKLPSYEPGPFYAALVALTGAVLAADGDYVRALLV